MRILNKSCYYYLTLRIFCSILPIDGWAQVFCLVAGSPWEQSNPSAIFIFVINSLS